MTEKDKQAFEKFRKEFNETVKIFKKGGYKSLEFIPDCEFDSNLFWAIRRATRIRGAELWPIKSYDGDTIGILFLKKPCDKFMQLLRWLNKYATKNVHYAFIEQSLYVADVCGKRGKWSLRDEHRKKYLCHNPEWCNRVKKTLQGIRHTGDQLEVGFRTVEDFENLEESIHNETELYGSVLHTMYFKVTTPGGKVKFDGVIY